MALYKRGNIWWIRFTTPDGQRPRESTQTADKVKAQEYHDTLKARLWRENRLGEAPNHT